MIEQNENQDYEMKFQLVSGIYLDAVCSKENKVILYLGSDTYVEYSY